MAKSIPGGVEIVNTLSTKNDGDYPLVKAESVGMNDGTTAEDNIKKKLDKNQGTSNNGKFMKVGADGNLVPENVPVPDVSGQINNHNTNDSAHTDIRELVAKLTDRLNTIANSDDVSLDQLSEIVAYIKNNKSLIEQVTTNKLNVADVVNNLTTNVTTKALSASMGVELKRLIDAIEIPDVAGQINTHNTSGTSHKDIRDEVAKKAGKSTTLSGYGITDGVTKSELSGHNTNNSAHADIRTDVTTLKEALKGFVPKNQGAENKGKALVVGEDGNVVVGEVQNSNKDDIIKALQNALISQVVSGDSINVTDSSGLPVEEFSMSGKTIQNGTPAPTNPAPIEVTPQGIITVDFTDGTNHQTINLNCPREFTKWDRLEKIDGVWNWVFQSKRVNLSEKLPNGYPRAWYIADKNENIYYSTILEDAYGGNQSSVCEKFKNVNLAYTEKYKGTYNIYCDHPVDNFSNKFFRQPNKTIQTLEQWEAWLSENPIELLYKTKEPELIPLSQSEQDKLNTLTTYAPTTTITNTGGCNMELTYTVDTKVYVDAKILTLSKALL